MSRRTGLKARQCSCSRTIDCATAVVNAGIPAGRTGAFCVRSLIDAHRPNDCWKLPTILVVTSTMVTDGRRPALPAPWRESRVLTVAHRRKRVAALLARRLTAEQIAEALDVSVRTVTSDTKAVRARMGQELSEWSVLDIANEMRQRSIMRDLESFAALEQAKQPTEGKPNGDFLAQKIFLSEMRANAKDELQLLQSLGVVYKAPERMAVVMMVMTQLEGLPHDTLAALADARDPEDFRRLLVEAVGDALARELLGQPESGSA